MYDLKIIRANPDGFDAELRKRGEEPISAKILILDGEIREQKTRLQQLQAARNDLAKNIGVAKLQGQDVEGLLVIGENLRSQIPVIEAEITALEERLQGLLVMLPNLAEEAVPFGINEQDNFLVRDFGQKRELSFTPKPHFELGENLKQMDFQQAAKMSGSRFVVLKDDLARLERALANFMLDLHVKSFGYTEVYPPYLVSDQAMFNTGQLPKFSEESFVTTGGYRLIPTVEVPLTNLVAGMIIAEEELPLRFTAYSPCFRSEAGSAGRDTRGMLRQHQFSKVELVSITRPRDSKGEHERMTEAAEEVLKKLEIPYRVMLLCSQDMGFSAQKTYDIEAWMPGQGCYREISSCSNCGSFQAIRMKTRYKEYLSKENHYVHTLNGSALAIGRTIIAIMENYQNEDGSITIPTILRSYMRDKKTIEVAR